MDVTARVTLGYKDSFEQAAHAPVSFEPVEVDFNARKKADLRACAHDGIGDGEPTVQVAREGAIVLVRFVDPCGGNYERYVGGMNLDFSSFKDGETRAKKIAEAFLGE